jgi:hypothetical protein
LHRAHAGRRAQILLDRAHHLVHRGEARALGRGRADLELGFVDVGRRVLLADRSIERHRRRDDGEREEHDDAAPAHRPREDRGIRPIDESIQAGPRTWRGSGRRDLRGEETRAHHGSEREGHEQAHQHGSRSRDPEL